MTYHLQSLRTRKGFTLIELLVVIAIIGILSAIVLANLRSATEKSKIAATKAQLNQIRRAFDLYYDTYNDYPPKGQDHCDMCSLIPVSAPYTLGTWQDIIDALVATKAISNSSQIQRDPWGHLYVYDKNYKINCFGYSPICSLGPDGVLQTFNCPSDPIAVGDDICTFIPDE